MDLTQATPETVKPKLSFLEIFNTLTGQNTQLQTVEPLTTLDEKDRNENNQLIVGILIIGLFMFGGIFYLASKRKS